MGLWLNHHYCKNKQMTRILFLLFYILLSSSLLHSQINNDTIFLNELEVISAVNPVAFKQISRSINIITNQQIKNSPVSNVSDLLKIYGGLDIRSRGAMGVQSDINLRGGTFDQSMIMLNGISLNDPQTGHHNLNQAIDFDDIEKIEVFEGPGTRWFGANAFSGGINIVSKTPQNNSLSLSVFGGMYGYFSGKLAVGYLIGNLKNRTSVGLKQSDGYVQNTDFKSININHNSYIVTKNAKININLGLLDKGFGANSFYTPKYPNQYEKIKTYFSSVTLETTGKVKFKTNVFWRRNYDRFELFREDKNWYKKVDDIYINGADTAGFPTPNGLYTYKNHNYHRTDIIGADAGFKIKSILGSTAISVSVKSEKIVSNVLGEPMNDTIFIKNSDGFYNKSKTRNTISTSLNQYYFVNNFAVSAGLSVFYNENYGAYVSPGIDLGYFINENVKIFANANRALRLPTFTDLYYQGPTNTSNPNLMPETSVSTEGGLKYFGKDINASISAYYSAGSNVIDWIKYSPDEKWQSANLSKLNTYGVAISLNKQFNKSKLNYIGVKYAWLNLDKQNSDFISLYALDFLRHNVNMYVNHNVFDKLTASWTFTAQQRNGSYVDFASGLETDYEAVFLLNLKLVYTYKNFDFSITGSNLLNKQYYDIGNVIQPGLWVIGGIKYSILK